MTEDAAALPLTAMAQEAAEAPAAVARQLRANAAAVAELAARLRARPPRAVLTCGRGSSDHALTFAKYLIETRLGLPVASMAPSIASVYGRRLAVRGMLYLAVSQSGRSPDIVASVEQAREEGALVAALVNDPQSPVAKAAELVLPLHAGPERSVAATKSFIASMAAVAQLVALWAEDRGLVVALEALPERLARAAGLDWGAALPALANADDVLVLGRGLGLAVAQEAALKLKETAALHAEAFSTAELRHGPLEILRPELPVLVFSQEDATRAGVVRLVQDLRAEGVPLFVAEAGGDAPGRLAVPEGMHPALEPMAMIQSFYGLAEAVARARGRDPDRPQFLSKVTETG
jgi:glucosamine--fructose-6-phosphate aminotransferase (isomerizing)